MHAKASGASWPAREADTCTSCCSEEGADDAAWAMLVCSRAMLVCSRASSNVTLVAGALWHSVVVTDEAAGWLNVRFSLLFARQRIAPLFTDVVAIVPRSKLLEADQVRLMSGSKSSS